MCISSNGENHNLGEKMKILCTSDLHMQHKHERVIDKLRELVAQQKPDVLVIAGDIVESSWHNCNVYKLLSIAFPDTTVIFVLGNHEFFYCTVEETRGFYERTYKPNKYDVHCLDVVGHYDVEGVRFVGNVLFYDGSMKSDSNQNLSKFADGRWADRTIKNFDWEEECRLNIARIKDNLPGPEDEIKTTILVTHCVPHVKLNTHTMSQFNAYSGVDNLFDRLSPKLGIGSHGIDWAVCGHTHRRSVGLRLNGCNCVNVGNDYYWNTLRVESYLIELPD